MAEPETQQHWCYSCDKRVSVETLHNSPDNIVCFECKNGFVESLPSSSNDDALAAVFLPYMPTVHGEYDYNDDVEFYSHRFLNAMRVLSLEARSLNAFRDEQPALTGEERTLQDDDDEEEEEGDRNDGVADEEEVTRWGHIGHGFRIGFGDIGRSGRDRILDWAEILLHSDDFDYPESYRYVGNTGDYVDGAEFEALLQNLAESDNGGRRGAPPASKEVVAGLLKEKIESDEQVVSCAVCKDSIGVGEMVTKLPCGHGYHENCIVPWLRMRNNCPVCRFELPTDDRDYEEEKKRLFASGGGSSSSS